MRKNYISSADKIKKIESDYLIFEELFKTVWIEWPLPEDNTDR